MVFFILKDNEQLGPYSDLDVSKCLQDGTFSGSDLAWTEGQSEWKPLTDILRGSMVQSAEEVNKKTYFKLSSATGAVDVVRRKASQKRNMAKSYSRTDMALALGLALIVGLFAGAWLNSIFDNSRNITPIAGSNNFESRLLNQPLGAITSSPSNRADNIHIKDETAFSGPEIIADGNAWTGVLNFEPGSEMKDLKITLVGISFDRKFIVNSGLGLDSKIDSFEAAGLKQIACRFEVVNLRDHAINFGEQGDNGFHAVDCNNKHYKGEDPYTNKLGTVQPGGKHRGYVLFQLPSESKLCHLTWRSEDKLPPYLTHRDVYAWLNFSSPVSLATRQNGISNSGIERDSVAPEIKKLTDRGLSIKAGREALDVINRYSFSLNDAIEGVETAEKKGLLGGKSADQVLGDPASLNNVLRVMSTARDVFN